MNLCLTSFSPSQCDALVEVFFVDYNSFNEVLHQPDFQIKVRIISPRIFPQARLLMFFPPSLRQQYDKFWQSSFEHDDILKIDMRWLAVLFMVLVFGCLLEWKRVEGGEGLRDREDAAQNWCKSGCAVTDAGRGMS